MKPIEQKDPPEEVSGGTTSDPDKADAFIAPWPAPLPFPQEPLTPVHFD